MKISTTLDCVSTAADTRSRHNNSTDPRQSQISERKSKDSNGSQQNRIPAGTTTEGVPTGKMTFSYCHQSGLAGCKSPPPYKRGASSCSSQRQPRRDHGAPLHDRVHLPTYLPALVLVRVLLPGRCPRRPPRGFLLLWRATSGPGRQVRGSATPRDRGVTSLLVCVPWLAEVREEAGGMTARRRAARGHSRMPGAALGPGCRGAAALLSGTHPGGEGGGVLSPGLPEGFRAGGAHWRWALRPLPRGAPARSSARRGFWGGGDGSCQGNAVRPPPIGPPHRFSAVPPIWRRRGVASRVLCLRA